MNNGQSFGVIALICGLAGIICSFIFIVPALPWVGLLLSFAAVILGGIGMSKSKNATGKADGLCITGLVLGIIGAVFCIVGAACATCVCGATVCLNEFSEWLSDILS